MAATKLKVNTRDEIVKLLDSAVKSMRFGGEAFGGTDPASLVTIQLADGRIGNECVLHTESGKFSISIHPDRMTVMRKEGKAVALIARYTFDAKEEPTLQSSSPRDSKEAKDLLKDVRDLRIVLVHSGALTSA